MDNKTVLVSSIGVFMKKGDKDLWFIVKNAKENEWEMPRTIVRKVESSVRAVIRMMGEQGGMTIRVLEEVGRAGGVTRINNRVLPQRHIYYLARHLADSGEAIGFEEYEWLEYSKASRKLTSKREKAMLKDAKKELSEWRKRKKKRKAKLLAASKELES